MNAPLRQTRGWVVTAAGLSQIAATRAGMLPWWGLPVTIILTMAVARQTGPVNADRSRFARGAGVAGVAVFAVFVAAKAIAAGRNQADPLATMRWLTEALVVLSLVMAPTWRSPRDYRVWLGVTTGVLVAATVGSHSAATDILLILTWVLVLLAMASIESAALTASVTIAIPAQAGPSPRRRRLGITTPAAASLTAGVLVFLALPAGLGGGGLAKHLVHRASNDPVGQQATRTVVGVDTFGDGTLDLLVRGALPTTPLLRVPLNSPALWRGSIYTVYTGDTWEAGPAQRFTYVSGNNTALPPSSIDPEPVGTTRVDRAEFVSDQRSSLLWAPGVPLRVQGNGGLIRGIFRGSASVRINGAQQITSYTVTSAVATTSPAQLEAATGHEAVSPEWTALPSELPTDVSALAHRLTAGATSRYQQVNELETYLRSHETYSLNSPVPGPGEDAVADFLFRDHTGFCEQFASAEAVLLRTLHVPARVVTGLAYGTRQGDSRLITAADAHAWVEVHYPGIGWSPTDPTAGVSLAITSQSASTSPVVAALHRLVADLPGGRIGLLALLLGLTVAVTVLARIPRSPTSSPDRDPATHPNIGPVLAAFHRFAGHRRHPTVRAPSETAREYVERVITPGRLDSAVAVLEQECYGTAAPARDKVTAAVAAFDSERLT